MRSRRIAGTRRSARPRAIADGRVAVTLIAALAFAAVSSCGATPTVAPRTSPPAARKPHAQSPPGPAAPPAPIALPGTADRGAPLEERMQTYAHARSAARAGRSDEARAQLAIAQQVLPELADYALIDAARLARRGGDVAAATAAYDRLLAEHPDSVWLAAAAVERGRIALDAGAASEASALFERAIADGDPGQLDAARLGKAQALAASGDRAAAWAIADDLRGKGGAVGVQARELGESLEIAGPGALGLEPAEFRLRVAQARLREGRADEAAAALAPLLEPGAPRRDEAALTLARIRARQRDPEAAGAAYGEAVRLTRDPEIAGTALFERGRMWWNRDDDAIASADFEAILERYPQHAKAPDAMHALGRIAETEGDFRRAAARYEAGAQRWPDSPLARELAWRAGFARYLAGDYAAAEAAFATLPGDDEAVYWTARAREAAGDRAGAEALYARVRERAPDSHLAWWVDARLGATAAARAPASADLPAPPEPLSTPPPALGAVATYHYSRGEILRALGFDRDAAREYAAVESTIGPDPALLDLYHGADAYPAMIRLARRLEGRDGGVAEAYLYPPAFEPQFRRAAAGSGVDPLLLLALSRQESLFDPGAVSPAGARGLMQLMPGTAASVAGGEVDAAALAVPETNVDLGTRYLRRLLDQYDGRVVLALAGYNAGPDAVARWQGRSFGRDGDEFVELISYRETKGYVKAVLRNYRMYRDLRGDARTPVRLY